MIASTGDAAAVGGLGSKDWPGWHVAAVSRYAAPLCPGRACHLGGLASEGVFRRAWLSRILAVVPR